jgi:hypothetical protein
MKLFVLYRSGLRIDGAIFDPSTQDYFLVRIEATNFTDFFLETPPSRARRLHQCFLRNSICEMPFNNKMLDRAAKRNY